MNRRSPHKLLLLLALTASAWGCSVATPPALEEDPQLAELSGEALPLSFAVAPVRLPGATPSDYASLSPLDSQVVFPDVRATWPEREYASEGAVVISAPEVQRRLRRVGEWVLGTRETGLLAAKEAGLAPSAGSLSDPDLVIELELLRSRCSWVERDGLWWWGNLFCFWGLGALPVVFVPDEVYALELEARLTVVEARSRKILLRENLSVSHEDSLNHPQRGWSVGGLLFLHPYTLGDEDLRRVAEVLWPQTARELEIAIAKRLRRKLRPQLERLLPDIRSGALGPRTLALVVGVDGPSSEWDFDRPPPLVGAVKDAEQVAGYLRGVGVQTRLLTRGEATGAQIMAELVSLGRRLRARDRLLVYFAGFGRTDREGIPAWVAADGPVRLRGLADELANHVPEGAAVDWVSDASFGLRGQGRTYPGGVSLARSSLGALVKGRPWRLLCAARPNQTAVERSARGEGGLLTEWLLAASAGAGDTNNDGQLSLREAWRFLGRWVPAEARALGSEQGPCIWGHDFDAPFLPVSRPEPAPRAMEPEPKDPAASEPESPEAEEALPEAPAPEPR
jgi:hypothetical protein